MKTIKKYKHLLESGEVVYIKGTYQKRWGDNDEYQLRLNDVRQLASIGKELTESITLKFAIEQISDTLIENISQLCTANKGPA